MFKRGKVFLRVAISLSVGTATMLHATNGDTLISVGTKARGMGGVGIAMSHGAESTLNNPALITQVEGTEISFGGTLFMPDIKTQLNTNPMALPAQNAMTSDADMNIIPEVSLAYKIDEKWYIGVGMWGTAGMGTDYSQGAGINNTLPFGQFNNFDMVTNLQLMQFAVPVAYKVDGLSIAAAPILQYGNLDINYVMPTGVPSPMTASIGAGDAQDFGFGVSLGATYDLHNGLILGAVYKSKIDMEYKNQLTTAAGPFGIALPTGDHLEQPAEMGIGLAYTMGQHTVALDYKKIQWSDAKGYKDFGWKDQNVYAVGYEYRQDNWALRAGYNYASTPIKENLSPSINMFNLLGFPATAEKHVTVGGTYAFSDRFSLDLAYVHALNNKESFNVSALGMGIDSVTTDHSEDSVSFQLTFKF